MNGHLEEQKTERNKGIYFYDTRANSITSNELFLACGKFESQESPGGGLLFFETSQKHLSS